MRNASQPYWQHVDEIEEIGEDLGRNQALFGLVAPVAFRFFRVSVTGLGNRRPSPTSQLLGEWQANVHHSQAES